MPRQMVLPQAIGFALVIVLIWADELIDVPHRLFGAPISPARVQEAVLESTVVAALGALVMFATWKLVRRLAYLESFVVLCSWCRRVLDDDRWVSFETFLGAHRVRPSHGLCPECAVRLDEEADALLPPASE
ncbi:MAG: hypothetical protein U0163_20305 [Gemmatimonadaceae bacterium]